MTTLAEYKGVKKPVKKVYFKKSKEGKKPYKRNLKHKPSRMVMGGIYEL